ncbi:hypothetical protein ABPG73_017751 [Tetrahymena malaccensis]
MWCLCCSKICVQNKDEIMSQERFSYFKDIQNFAHSSFQGLDYEIQQCNLMIDEQNNIYFEFNGEVFYRREELGKGCFSKVYKVLTKNRIFALKMLVDEGAVEEYQKEFKILQQIQHPFIIKFYDCLQVDGKLCFLMEYAEKGTLDQFLKNPYQFGLQSPVTLIDLAENIVLGIKYLQGKKIIHRDLKPQNILLTKDFQAKIGDLGLAKLIVTNQALTKQGNIMYAAPEKKEDNSQIQFGLPSDIYSVGLIICELLLKLNPLDVIRIQQSHKDQILDGTPQPLRSLLESLIATNPDDRPDCQAILNQIRSFKVNQEILLFLRKKYQISDLNNPISINIQQQNASIKIDKDIESQLDQIDIQQGANLQKGIVKNEDITFQEEQCLYEPLIQSKSKNPQVNNNNYKKEIKIQDVQLNVNDHISRIDHKIYLKVALLGETQVGKTQIVNRYLDNQFNQIYDPTIGGYLTQKLYQNDNLKIYFFDLSGNQKYQPTNNLFLKDTDIVVIVYSIVDRNSFLQVENQINKARKYCQNFSDIILIGNKSDMEEQRQITYEEGRNFAFALGVTYFFETSAKENKEITESLKIIFSLAAIREQQLSLKRQQSQTKKLDGGQKQNKKTTNCCN